MSIGHALKNCKFYVFFIWRQEGDVFPAIKKLLATDGKLYAQTYKGDDKQTEFFVFDEDGKFEKSLFLPIDDSDAFNPAIFCIKKGKLYNLVENEDEEVMELHITEIK